MNLGGASWICSKLNGVFNMTVKSFLVYWSARLYFGNTIGFESCPLSLINKCIAVLRGEKGGWSSGFPQLSWEGKNE